MAFRYKLETDFYKNEVVHTTYRSDLTLRVRKMVIKTRWCRDGELGTGAFGVVWREENQSTKELRAVKIIPKHHFQNFREVDANGGIARCETSTMKRLQRLQATNAQLVS